MQLPALILAAGLLFTSFSAYSQERCGTVDYTTKKRTDLKIHEKDADFERWLGQKIQQRLKNQKTHRTQSIYQVPVVVHVLYNMGDALGQGTNIPTAQINSQISVLNKDYNRLNADASSTPPEFAALAGDMDIEFVLAKRTPEGLPTNGIVRVQSPQTSWTSFEDAELKAVSYWPAEEYLNIWICNLTDYLAYSQFPESSLPGLEDSPDERLTDGIVFNYKVFGSIDDGSFNLNPKYNKGRTATHEIGHFFGLRHIWGDANDCVADDYVSDTPVQARSTFNNPAHPLADACSSAIMFQNFLDYTDDVSMNLFTQQQVTRMITVLENSPRRASLLTSPGLIEPDPTGTNIALQEILAPLPVECDNTVTPSIRVANIGTAVISTLSIDIYINETLLGTVEVAGLLLDAGDEMIVTIQDLTFPVRENLLRLEITEANGVTDSDDSDNVRSIKFIVDDSKDEIPLRENFEHFENTNWSTVSPDNGTPWELADLGSTSALYVNGFDNPNLGEQAWFVSPILNLSDVEQARMFFDLSYAYRDGYDDELAIVASLDCGQSFDHLLGIYGGAGISARTSSSAWLPSTSDFETLSVPLGSLLGNDEVRIAFVFTNGHGNNLYLDNIEFFLSNDPTPVIPEDGFFVFYPNYPTLDQVGVTLNLPEREYVKIEIVDTMGKVLESGLVPNALNQTFIYDISKLAGAIYILRIYTPEKAWVTKIMTHGYD